jgi:hypothetical protein
LGDIYPALQDKTLRSLIVDKDFDDRNSEHTPLLSNSDEESGVDGGSPVGTRKESRTDRSMLGELLKEHEALKEKIKDDPGLREKYNEYMRNQNEYGEGREKQVSEDVKELEQSLTVLIEKLKGKQYLVPAQNEWRRLSTSELDRELNKVHVKASDALYKRWLKRKLPTAESVDFLRDVLHAKLDLANRSQAIKNAPPEDKPIIQAWQHYKHYKQLHKRFLVIVGGMIGAGIIGGTVTGIILLELDSDGLATHL